MIDSKGRLELIRRIDSFLEDQITNDDITEFGYRCSESKGNLMRSQDGAVAAICGELLHMYDDCKSTFTFSKFCTHPGVDAVEQRKTLAHLRLFLSSGLEYEYPRFSWGWLFRRLLGVFVRSVAPKPCVRGDEDVWPFFRREDLEAAKGQSETRTDK
ncbi:MAG: hypothetical protein GY851_17960 [bacterium]|nr:hypothetical protein [bacterium]